MNWPRPIRVIGVGSPLGDDALGWKAVCALRDRLESHLDVEFHVVDGGQRILDILDGRGTLLLVDALLTGESAGTIHRLDWPHPDVEVLRPGSTHHLRPAEALRLASALGLLPQRVVIFGIEAENFAPHEGLSSRVASAVPELARRIEDELVSGQQFRKFRPTPAIGSTDHNA